LKTNKENRRFEVNLNGIHFKSAVFFNINCFLHGKKLPYLFTIHYYLLLQKRTPILSAFFFYSSVISFSTESAYAEGLMPHWDLKKRLKE